MRRCEATAELLIIFWSLTDTVCENNTARMSAILAVLDYNIADKNPQDV